MPSFYDNPQVFANAVVEDVNKFNRLPFYLVQNEATLFPQWNIYDQLLGDINWQPNMGDTMKGVRPEPSPVGRATFYPLLMSAGDPNKDVFETLESTEQMQLRWHDYSSKIFAFLPSWQDFRTNQLDFNHKDLVKQIQTGNNIFIRTIMFDLSPNVIIAGGGANGNTDLFTGCPTTLGNPTQDAAGSKTSNWIATFVVPKIKSNLSYRAVKNSASIFSEDLAVPFFEGSKNMPKPNEQLKGTYALLGSNGDWIQFDDDPDILQKRDLAMNLANNDFEGKLANGKVIFKSDRFQLRFNDDGVFIAPQIVEKPSNKTRPNPAWISAKYAVAMFMGADCYRSVKVGAPPKDFTGMDKDKFYKMRWNGEISLTDQFLIYRGTIAGGDYQPALNNKGRFLRLEATTTHGILPQEVYNCVPIFYRIQRKATA